MSLRLLWCLLCAGLLAAAALCGCDQSSAIQADEQKNPHFIVGKERVAARDYRGAIEAFERALEVNPRSGLAHFELGLLYEQHDDNENHLISAMYHYKRSLDIRPTGYPSDHARMRMVGCKQELVKSESLAPIYQTMQRDLERLKEENQLLKTQLESLQAGTGAASQSQLSSATPSQARPPSNAARNPAPAPAGRNPTPAAANGPRAPQPAQPARPAPSRSYTIKSGDTLASIARSQRVRLESLQAANPGLDPKRIKVGQTLVIPPH